ncbi:MAG: hypothetical protein HYR90_04845 [Candidatus Andersenbacteria bacterium]|nr:hypothetical protein [Candidatus Andersenbacteria bacterium]
MVKKKINKKQPSALSKRHFGVTFEKVGRDEFALLEKRVMALEKSKNK